MINVKGTAISLPAYMTTTAEALEEKPVKLTKDQKEERFSFLSTFRSKLSNTLTSNHSIESNQQSRKSSLLAKEVAVMSTLERQRLAQ